MKKLILIVTLIMAFASASVAQDPGWPRQKTSSAGKLIYYQPHVDSWTNYQDLQFRMAFSMTPTGGKQVVGVLGIKAKTDVNVDARTVLLSRSTLPIVGLCGFSLRQTPNHRDTKNTEVAQRNPN